jgi:hypothetical protein
MWIFPTECELTRFWIDEKRKDHFVLQKSKTEQNKLFRDVFGTFQNIFITKQPPYRIVLLSPNDKLPSTAIAVGKTLEDILQDWNWMELHIFPLLKDLESFEDIQRFTKGKIQSLITQKDGSIDDLVEDHKFRDANRAFKDLFKLPEEERLVNYYSCTLWKKMPQQGWMYVSSHHICFYSFILGIETKLILEMKDITVLEKTRSVGIVPNGIQISSKNDQQVSLLKLHSI